MGYARNSYPTRTLKLLHYWSLRAALLVAFPSFKVNAGTLLPNHEDASLKPRRIDAIPSVPHDPGTYPSEESSSLFVGKNSQQRLGLLSTAKERSDANHRRSHRYHRRKRHLQDGSCSFDSLVANACTLEEFCTASSFIGITASCNIIGDDGGGDNVGQQQWTLQYQYETYCYDDFLEDDFGYPLFSEDEPRPVNGYCSLEQETFEFHENFQLVSVTLTEVITHPWSEQQPSWSSRYSTSDPCPANSLPDYVFGTTAGFCQAPCPNRVTIDDVDCQGSCTVCDLLDVANTLKKASAYDCTSIDASLVESCTASPVITNGTRTTPTDLLEAVLVYWKETLAPRPVQAPVGVVIPVPPVRPPIPLPPVEAPTPLSNDWFLVTVSPTATPTAAPTVSREPSAAPSLPASAPVFLRVDPTALLPQAPTRAPDSSSHTRGCPWYWVALVSAAVAAVTI